MSVEFSHIQTAARRIAPLVRKTPVLTSRSLDVAVGASVFLKCENFQSVGAFKFRGACNALQALPDAELVRGVATHSSGNHGAALALAGQRRGVSVTVVMPQDSSAVKFAAVESYGARIVKCEPEIESRAWALQRIVAESGASVVHPFDNYDVIAGQGTAALELLQEIDRLDLVVAPVGGGGLLSGTAIATKGLSPSTAIIGAEPSGADDAARSFTSGERLTHSTPDTIADGLRATVGRLTFPIIYRLANDIVAVDDAATIRAMRFVWERLKIVIEPSAAVSIAALMERLIPCQGLRVGVILTGGNVDLDNLPW